MSGYRPKPGNKSPHRSNWAVGVSRQLRKAGYKILYADMRHKREGVYVVPSGDDRVLVSLDYHVYSSFHRELLDDLVVTLREDLSYEVETNVSDDHMHIYVSRKPKEAPVSKTVYRALVKVHRYGYPRTVWRCEHEHNSWQLAAQCGQLELRRRLPNSKTPSGHFQFDRVEADIEVKSFPWRNGEWGPFTNFVEHHGGTLPA